MGADTGYEVSLRGPAPKDEKEPLIFYCVESAVALPSGTAHG